MTGLQLKELKGFPITAVKKNNDGFPGQGRLNGRRLCRDLNATEYLVKTFTVCVIEVA